MGLSGVGIVPGEYRWDVSTVTALVLVLAAAAVLRGVFFTGFFGGDEVTYVQSALRIVQGDWTATNYIGAIRYGINAPMAMFMSMFGVNEFAANLWSLLASLVEIGLVFLVGLKLWGLRGAVLSALVLACIPLHVHLAGRLEADLPLAACITLSFVFFLEGLRRDSARCFFLCGLACGVVFWIKELVSVFGFAFILYAALTRQFDRRWVWLAAGGALPVVLNLVFMWWAAGDPLHVYNVTRRAVEGYAGRAYEMSPWFYFKYLFLDVRHTWLLGVLAVLGLLVWAGRKWRGQECNATFVVFWAFALIGIFSFTVIGVNPELRWIAKQTNYMTIFLAPLALLAGYWLSRLSGKALAVALVLYVPGAVALSGLEQQAIRVFTANSLATVEWSKTVTDAPVYAMTNGYRAGIYYRIFGETRNAAIPVRSFGDLRADLDGRTSGEQAERFRAYVVFDPQTSHWGRNPIISLADAPACWSKVGVLDPVMSGAGTHFTEMGYRVANLIGGGVGDRVATAFDKLRRPEPAILLGVPPNCRWNA